MLGMWKQSCKENNWDCGAQDV